MRSGVSAPLALTDYGRFQAFARRQAGRAAGAGAVCRRRLRAGQPRHLERRRSELQPRHRQPGHQRHGLSRRGVLRPRHAVLRPVGGRRAGAGGDLGRSASSPRAASTAWPGAALAWFGAALLFAAIAGCMTPPPTWPLPTGLGGVFGDMVLKIPGAVHRRLSDAAWSPACSRVAAGRARRSGCSPTAPACSPRKNGFAVARATGAQAERGRGRPTSTTTRTTTKASWRSARSPIGGCRRAPSCAARSARYRGTTTGSTMAGDAPAAGVRAAERVEYGRARRSPGQRRRPRPRRAGILRRDGRRTAPRRVDPDDDDDFDDDDDDARRLEPRAARAGDRCATSARDAGDPRRGARRRARCPARASSARRRPR